MIEQNTLTNKQTKILLINIFINQKKKHFKNTFDEKYKLI